MPSKLLAVNNYVLFRYKEEWIECRVKELITSPNKTSQTVILHIPKYNITHPDPIPDDLIHLSSIENIKKFKISYQNIEMPIFFLNFLQEDKLKIKNNFVVKIPTKISVRNIINDFATYINKNKIIYEDELDEMISGFNHCFNETLYNHLLYEKEIYQWDKIMNKKSAEKPCDMYGIEHLVRMLYYCKIYVECEVFLEYLFYILDYLDMNYKKYFNDREYEELK